MSLPPRGRKGDRQILRRIAAASIAVGGLALPAATASAALFQVEIGYSPFGFSSIGATVTAIFDDANVTGAPSERVVVESVEVTYTSGVLNGITLVFPNDQTTGGRSPYTLGFTNGSYSFGGCLRGNQAAPGGTIVRVQEFFTSAGCKGDVEYGASGNSRMSASFFGQPEPVQGPGPAVPGAGLLLLPVLLGTGLVTLRSLRSEA